MTYQNWQKCDRYNCATIDNPISLKLHEISALRSGPIRFLHFFAGPRPVRVGISKVSSSSGQIRIIIAHGSSDQWRTIYS